MFQLLTKINTLKLQIFFMQMANMKMHYSFISCGLLHLDQMKCSHWDLKILKTKMGKNLFCITQTRRIKGRSSLSLKNFYTQVMNFKEMKINNGTYQKDHLQLRLGKQLQVILFLIWQDQNFKRNFQEICKVNSRYEIKPKRHQNVIYFKWVYGAWNSKGILA